MYGRALLGAGLGAGSGAAVSDPENRTRNMIIGAGLGAGLGAGSKLLTKPNAALGAPSAGKPFKPAQTPIAGTPQSTALSRPVKKIDSIDSFTPPKGQSKQFEESFAQAKSEGFQGSKKEFYDDVFNVGSLDDTGRTVTKAVRPESFKYYQEGMTRSQLKKRQRALHPDRVLNPTREQMDEFAEVSDILRNADDYGLKLASFFSRAFFY